MAKRNYPLYLANQALATSHTVPVKNKYSGEVIAEVATADQALAEQALQASVNAFPLMRKLSSYERRKILQHCLKRFQERKAELIEVLIEEVGKTKPDAESEIDRFLGTFDLAADEATRLNGEILPLDTVARGLGFRGAWKRVPVGPCLFITPFNFPFNLVAHKIAPAIAVGCPFILKPAPATLISAMIIGEVLAETDLPKGAFSILPCDNEIAEKMVIDPRTKLLSFTGSAKVGWELKSKAGKKQVVLELGGNAACIVDEGVDLDVVVPRLVFGGYYIAGQSCISVQRIMVHQSIYANLRDKLKAKVALIKWGDPKDPTVFLGPLINEEAAIRVETWINEAVKKGANLLCGGKRHGSIIEAALLENVPREAKLNTEEAFGPVTIISSFNTFEEALKQVNDSRYGLQAGVFTHDIKKINLAWDLLEVGGVIINEIPSFRADNMPYGGSKDSGIGREGVRFAIEHLTEIRMLVVKD